MSTEHSSVATDPGPAEPEGADPESPPSRRWNGPRRRGTFLVVLLALLVAPALIQPFHLEVLTRVVIFALLAMSLDLIYGYAGMVSLGHAAFFGAGGYATGLLMVRWEVTDFWTGMVAALVVSAALAAVVGFVALRTRGIYFILVTFAMGQMVYSLAEQWDFFHTSGAEALVGVAPPTVAPFTIEWTQQNLYYLVLVVCLAGAVVLHLLTHSGFGAVLKGIRENEPRMQVLGYNTWLYKYAAFVISGAVAGMAGNVFAYYAGIIAPSNVDVSQSGLLVLMVIMGGVGRLYGAAVGAAVITVVQFLAVQYIPERQDMVMGVLFVLTLIALLGEPRLRTWRARRREALA